MSRAEVLADVILVHWPPFDHLGRAASLPALVTDLHHLCGGPVLSRTFDGRARPIKEAPAIYAGLSRHLWKVIAKRASPTKAPTRLPLRWILVLTAMAQADP